MKYIHVKTHKFPSTFNWRRKNKQVLADNSDNILSRLTLCINVVGEDVGNWDSGDKAPKRDHRSIYLASLRSCMQ